MPTLNLLWVWALWLCFPSFCFLFGEFEMSCVTSALQGLRAQTQHFWYKPVKLWELNPVSGAEFSSAAAVSQRPADLGGARGSSAALSEEIREANR